MQEDVALPLPFPLPITCVSAKHLRDPALQCRRLAASVYRVVLKWGI